MENRNYFLDEEKFRNGYVKDEADLTLDDDVKDKDKICSFKNLGID